MTRRNLWLWITLASALVFVIPLLAGVPADWAAQVHRFILFVIVSVAFSRYIVRAPFMWWEGDMRPEAKQIIGFAVVLFGILYQNLYAWIFVAIGRPDALLTQYWSDGSVFLMVLGFLFIAWSTNPPRPMRLRGSRVGSYLVGLLTGLGLMLSGILPQAIRLLGMALGKVMLLLPH